MYVWCVCLYGLSLSVSSNCATLIFLECSKEFLFLAAKKMTFLVQTVQVIFSNAYKLLPDILNSFSDKNY